MKRGLPDFLNEPARPARAILLGWPLVSLPALGLAALFGALFPAAPTPQFPGDPGLVFFLVTIFAPVVETLIMAAVLELLLRVVPPGWAVALSALGWGIAHSLQAPTWGLVIWWPFLIFSLLYVAWRKRSVAGAIGIVSAVHALNNFIPALLLLRSA